MHYVMHLFTHLRNVWIYFSEAYHNSFDILKVMGLKVTVTVNGLLSDTI